MFEPSHINVIRLNDKSKEYVIGRMQSKEVRFMRPFFRRHILNVPDHRIANWALTVRQDQYVLCLLSGRVISLESLVCMTSRQACRCSIMNESTEHDQRGVLILMSHENSWLG